MNDQVTEEMADEELVERVLAGEHRAFAEIVRRYDRRLRALVDRLLPVGVSADDVMQDAWLKAFKALSRFRGDASLGTWLYRITSNVCMDHLRRRRPVFVQPADDEPELVWGGPNPAEVAADRHALGEALAGLKAGHRDVFLLVEGDGLDYAEAASVLGLPLGTVASRLSRARADLRRALEPAVAQAA